MLPAHIIRSLAKRNFEKNIYLANAAVRHVFSVRYQATQTSPSVAPKSEPLITPELTTGWNQAKWPQQEMMEIHRRVAKHESPALERRRQMAVLKVLIAIGAGFVAYIFFACFCIMFIPWEFHAPWHTTGIPTPWTNGGC